MAPEALDSALGEFLGRWEFPLGAFLATVSLLLLSLLLPDRLRLSPARVRELRSL